MVEQLLQELRHLREVQSDCCVSIIVPLKEGFAHTKENEIAIKNAFKEAERQLKQCQNNKESIEALELLKTSYSFHSGGGTFVGFASKDYVVYFQLPFTTKPKVVVDNSFEVRDLIFTINRLTRYWVLHLSLKKPKLYIGLEKHLTDHPDFSMASYQEMFKPEGKATVSVFTHTIRGYDEAKKEQQWLQLYFKRIVDAIEPFMTERIPLWVMGTEKDIGYFRKAFKHKERIAGEIRGNYEYLSPSQLAEIVWPEVQKYLAQQRVHFLEKTLQNAYRERLVSEGIVETWQFAMQQRIRILGVERGYVQPAWTNKNEPSEILLEKPEDEANYHYHKDIIDDLIEAVVSIKNAEVIFFEPGQLEKQSRVVGVRFW